MTHANIKPERKMGHELLWDRAAVEALVEKRAAKQAPKAAKTPKQQVLPLGSHDQALTLLAEELAHVNDDLMSIKSWVLYLAGAAARPAEKVPLGVRPPTKGNGEAHSQPFSEALQADRQSVAQSMSQALKPFKRSTRNRDKVGDLKAAEERLLAFLGGKSEVLSNDAYRAMFPDVVISGPYHKALNLAMLALGWVKRMGKAPGVDGIMRTHAFWHDPHPSHPVGPVPPAVPAGPRTID